MRESDISGTLQQQVLDAFETKRPLRIQGGNTKAFYGRELSGNIESSDILDVSGHGGIINYEPTELVITARAGTPLIDIEQALAAQNQILGFEPPHFGENATLGGTIASNFSGPRRAAAGAARDFVLGSKLINGKGEILTFGGQVMKNVAGYDVSRLICGSLGTLGVILELSLKVLPKPEMEITLMQKLEVEAALARLQSLGRRALPVSASCVDGRCLYIRLSGSAAAVDAARNIIGGELMQNHNRFWQELREQHRPFFKTELPLWRISVASTAPPLNLPGNWLYEWDGAQRWLVSEVGAEAIREAVNVHGGHAVCFRSLHKPDAVFHPLDKGLMRVHQNLKRAFDPAGIFNPGKMYQEI